MGTKFTIIENGIIAQTETNGTRYFKSVSDLLEHLTEVPVKELENIIKTHEMEGVEYVLTFELKEPESKKTI